VKILAGGQSLVPMLNLRYALPSDLVDINHVEEWRGIVEEGDRIAIGALTRQHELLASSVISRCLPMLMEALRWVGHRQTRARGTIGGSLCHLDPAAEIPLVALVHDAELQVEGPDGARFVPMADWCLGYMTPALEPGEVLVRIRFGSSPVNCAWGFREFARRHGDFAITAAAVLVTIEQGIVRSAAIGLGGVQATAIRLPDLEETMRGRSVAECDALIAPHMAEINCTSDAYYSADYRRQLATTLLRRTFADACGRSS
jgi:aerobic carbon-monoxide dehydrogenase medium subunit